MIKYLFFLSLLIPKLIFSFDVQFITLYSPVQRAPGIPVELVLHYPGNINITKKGQTSGIGQTTFTGLDPNTIRYEAYAYFPEGKVSDDGYELATPLYFFAPQPEPPLLISPTMKRICCKKLVKFSWSPLGENIKYNIWYKNPNNDQFELIATTKENYYYLKDSKVDWDGEYVVLFEPIKE